MLRQLSSTSIKQIGNTSFVRCASSNLFVKSISHVNDPVITSSGDKVTIVGVGNVGMACAVSILLKNVSSNLVLIDRNKNKLMGEVMDIREGSSFNNNATVIGSIDYEASAGSRLCIVTVGIAQRPGQSRLELIQKNTEVFKSVIPELVKYNPDAVFLIVSNPVDILSYVTWKISGLPQSRIIGSGTNLDSARFKYYISKKLGISPTSCDGWIIGEHGDSSVPIWSSVNVAGIRLNELIPNFGEANDLEKWNEQHMKVVNSAYNIIKLKGYTSWGIGLSISDLAFSILRNTNNIHAISTLIDENYDKNFKDPVYLSLPCVLTSKGVSHIVKPNFKEHELVKLKNSAKVLHDIQTNIVI